MWTSDPRALERMWFGVFDRTGDLSSSWVSASTPTSTLRSIAAPTSTTPSPSPNPCSASPAASLDEAPRKCRSQHTPLPRLAPPARAACRPTNQSAIREARQARPDLWVICKISVPSAARTTRGCLANSPGPAGRSSRFATASPRNASEAASRSSGRRPLTCGFTL